MFTRENFLVSNAEEKEETNLFVCEWEKQIHTGSCINNVANILRLFFTFLVSSHHGQSQTSLLIFVTFLILDPPFVTQSEWKIYTRIKTSIFYDHVIQACFNSSALCLDRTFPYLFVSNKSTSLDQIEQPTLFFTVSKSSKKYDW